MSRHDARVGRTRLSSNVSPAERARMRALYRAGVRVVDIARRMRRGIPFARHRFATRL